MPGHYPPFTARYFQLTNQISLKSTNQSCFNQIEGRSPSFVASLRFALLHKLDELFATLNCLEAENAVSPINNVLYSVLVAGASPHVLIIDSGTIDNVYLYMSRQFKVG